uniref:Uncharacterized protein n=1 Tax=viral metagenome TaxID=1070528 RepID=A0A6H1ZR05_9ZZZZ
MEMRNQIAFEVSRSVPSCGINAECNTECGTCGADRIKLIILDWLNKHTNKMTIEQFERDWNE